MISLTPYLAFRPAPRMIKRVSYPPFLDSDCTPGIPERASFRPNILVSLISSLVTTLTPAGISSVARSVLVAVTTTSSRSIFLSFGCSAYASAQTSSIIASSKRHRILMSSTSIAGQRGWTIPGEGGVFGWFQRRSGRKASRGRALPNHRHCPAAVTIEVFFYMKEGAPLQRIPFLSLRSVSPIQRRDPMSEKVEPP